MKVFITKLHKAKLISPTAYKGKLKPQILSEVQDILENDVYGRKWSKENYPGGFTTYSSVNKLHKISSTFDDLRKKIDQEVYKFIKELDLNISSKEIKMDNFWMNIMGDNCRHTSHIHPKSIISGTFYVNLPKNTAPIRFEDPRMMFFMNSPLKKEKAKLENQIYVSPKILEGELILFESWLRHEVLLCKGKEKRISLSFNYS